ncbi:class II fructose-bisphosphate aldolase [Propionicicella superfundia]|uniref:class II fructose-bisphosphate aldolase n=1 Tax=Propionicicella superfundia TaxID=348582 RepID=UPI0004166FB2|nr:class II fructose-bisphosphate aldolase [Propionicicella superfundia]
MPVANTLELVRAAQAGGYAIPAVNIVDELSMRAVVEAAEEARSAIILQTSVKTVKASGAEPLSFLASHLADRSSVPVALHLDHCPDRAVITTAIEGGWSSVLFDASDRPLDAARAETAEVCAEAHAAGVTVESEIENIVGVEDGVGSDELTHSYSVPTLLEVAQETGTDLLAPQLGTAHGLYKADPVLRFDRVREIRALSDIPVVLHGGTGLSPADFGEFIAAGVGKINISTALKLAYMKACKAHLEEAERVGKWEPVKMFDQVKLALVTEIGAHIALFGSGGKI